MNKKRKGRVFKNILMVGDARNLPYIPDESVELIITSPPYHDLMDYEMDRQIGRWQTREEFMGSMEEVALEWERVLIPGGVLAVNTQVISYSRSSSGLNYRTEWNYPGDLARLIESTTSLIRYETKIWNKGTSQKQCGLPYPHENSGYLDAEEVTIFIKPGLREVPSSIREDSRISEDDVNELASGIWTIQRGKGRINEDCYVHPCPFPSELAARVIKQYSYVGDTVLDSFAGIANTCIAAAKLDRNFIGIDLNPKYLEYAVKRFSKMKLLDKEVEILITELKDAA